jgi:hypothetical protein
VLSLRGAKGDEAISLTNDTPSPQWIKDLVNRLSHNIHKSKTVPRQTMTFDEVLDQVREFLQSKGRLAYRALKRRLELDNEYLEDLKAELIKAEGVAADEDGEVLVWLGAAPVQSSEFKGQS